MKKYHDNGLEKHRKLRALNSDRNPTGRILTSDVRQHRRKREFKEQKIAPLMLKKVLSQTWAIKTNGKSDPQDRQWRNPIG